MCHETIKAIRQSMLGNLRIEAADEETDVASHRIYLFATFEKVNPSTKSSTYCSVLLIKILK